MKTDAVTPADLARSVIAVPPLARAANGAVSLAENRKILEWMAAGGISTFLYGGNANFYNLGLLEYPLTLEVLSGIAPKGAFVIPSIGPDFGKALDQVTMLKSFDFPTAMALPMASATKPAGVATGLRRLADAYGRPVVAYVRAETYLAVADIAALLADGVRLAGIADTGPLQPYLANLDESQTGAVAAAASALRAENAQRMHRTAA